jgi:hypothetical protein
MNSEETLSFAYGHMHSNVTVPVPLTESKRATAILVARWVTTRESIVL